MKIAILKATILTQLATERVPSLYARARSIAKPLT